MKQRTALRVLCHSKISIKLKIKFYKTSIRCAIFNYTGCWIVKKQHVHEMNVIEIKNIKMNKWKYKKKQDFKLGELLNDKDGLLLINR